MLKFYRWLFKWSQEQCKKYISVDLKCPTCLLWLSATDGNILNERTDGYTVRCKNCKTETEWRTDLFPMPVRRANYPVNIEKVAK